MEHGERTQRKKVDKPIQISIRQRHKARSHDSNEKRQLQRSKQTQRRRLLAATCNTVNSTSLLFVFRFKRETSIVKHINKSNFTFPSPVNSHKYFPFCIYRNWSTAFRQSGALRVMLICSIIKLIYGRFVYHVHLHRYPSDGKVVACSIPR